MTDIKIKEKELLNDQLEARLKKALFEFPKSARNFFGDNDKYGAIKAVDEYEE